MEQGALKRSSSPACDQWGLHRTPLCKLNPGQCSEVLGGGTPPLQKKKRLRCTLGVRKARTVFSDRLIPVRNMSSSDALRRRLFPAQIPGVVTENTDSVPVHKRILDKELVVNVKTAFTYSVKPHTALNHDDNVPGSTIVPLPKPAGRSLRTRPDRCLDCPNLFEDFNKQPLDWSKNDAVAIALFSQVYIWDPRTEGVHCLVDLLDSGFEDCAASCVSWTQAGTHLGVGSSDGAILLFDVVANRRIRCLESHASSVVSLSWNGQILSSVSVTGTVLHSDFRIRDSCVGKINGAHGNAYVHCLAWSHDGRYLASGGGDGTVKIWIPSEGALRSSDSSKPVHVFKHAKGVVKAVAWCPWNLNLVASGGNERAIRLWNASSGLMRKECRTQSGVSALAWSEEYHEIVSAHDGKNYEIVLWRCPDFEVVARLTGHKSLILGMCVNPEKTTLATASADETLRFWNCFPVDEERKKAKAWIEMRAKGGRSVLDAVMLMR